jgi:adenylate cyclase
MKPAYYQQFRGWPAVALLLLYAWLCVWVLPRDTFVTALDDIQWAAFPVEHWPLVHVVDIDDASLARFGRWPWPRSQLAELIRTLDEDYRVAVVGLDIVLSEPSGQDQALREVAQNVPLVWAVAPALQGEAALLQGDIGPASACTPEISLSDPAVGYLGVAESLVSTQMRTGHVRPKPDRDGVIRNYISFVAIQSRCIPALGLAVWAEWLGVAADAEVAVVGDELIWGGVPLGVGADGLLRLRNMQPAVSHVSAAEVLSGQAQLPPGAIVLVGSSALGVGDIISLPGQPRAAGVNVHAYALAQWLSGSFVKGESWRLWAEFVLLVAAFLGALYISHLSVLKLWLYWLLLTAGWWCLSALGHAQGIVFSMVPFVWASLALPVGLGVNVWQAKSARNLLYHQFSAYLSSEVLDELVRQGADPRALDAQSCEITIMFADIRRFTALSESLPSEQVVSLLNEVMSFLAAHIARHGGTLDKFLGDGVMAFWGAPLPMEDHADRAVACACDIVSELDSLNAVLGARGWPAIRFGIGIHTGEAAVGNMGSAERRAYSAVGDAVNLAARLEALSSDNLASILVSEPCALQCRTHVFHDLGPQTIRGRRAGVNVFTPTGVSGAQPAGGPRTEPASLSGSATRRH